MIQAKMRLLAWEFNSVRRDSNIFPDFRLSWAKLKKIGKRSGAFQVYGGNRGVYIIEGANNIVGILTLRHNNVDKSWINPKFKGRGLGMLLYESALKHFRRLSSSDSLSPGSSVLWKSLCIKYGGYLVVKRSNRKIKVSIVGWTEENGFAIPIVSTDTGNKSLKELLRDHGPINRNAASDSYYEVTL